MTCAVSAFTRAKNEATMWNAFVVAIKFFLRNEVYYSFITYEVVSIVLISFSILALSASGAATT